MTFNFETGARLGHISYNAVDNGAFIEEDQTALKGTTSPIFAMFFHGDTLVVAIHHHLNQISRAGLDIRIFLLLNCAHVAATETLKRL